MGVRLTLLAVGVLGLVFTSGCTTSSHGSPQPATTGPSSSNSADNTTGNEGDDLPYAGAPKVDDPLDTSRYEQDPCQSLTADQTEPLNLPPNGKPMENVALGNGCEWKNTESRGYAQIVFADGDQDGLSSEYQANEDGDWEYFEELPKIDGYPAITRAGTDSRDVGHCIVVVGVADDMVFESIGQLSEANIKQKDPCEMAALAASLALQTMKAGS
jgi:hypothetical protein